MKLGKIVDAVSALRKIGNQNLKLKTAYQVCSLIESLNKHLAFFDKNMERIQKLADNQDKELAELLEMEIEPEYEKVEIYLDENVSLTALDIMNLKEFIIFKEKEKQD